MLPHDTVLNMLLTKGLSHKEERYMIEKMTCSSHCQHTMVKWIGVVTKDFETLMCVRWCSNVVIGKRNIYPWMCTVYLMNMQNF